MATVVSLAEHVHMHELLVLSDFFNWNRVKIRYCDGASFSGDGGNKVG